MTHYEFMFPNIDEEGCCRINCFPNCNDHQGK